MHQSDCHTHARSRRSVRLPEEETSRGISSLVRIQGPYALEIRGDDLGGPAQNCHVLICLGLFLILACGLGEPDCLGHVCSILVVAADCNNVRAVVHNVQAKTK